VFGIEEKIALEAIKPAGGLIGALLEQKIKKVRAWSEKKELESKLNPDTFAKLMENYLINLAYKVNEITSIAFPQIKLPINEAYEPLSLYATTPDRNKRENIPFKSIINASNSNLLLIDSAGMGKSTFSKYVVSQILLKSDRIPILFELRKVNMEDSLIENLAQQFDCIGELFDRQLFCKLLSSGKFYVVADGFDEVPLEHQEKLSSLLHSFSIDGGSNVILLTSRPQSNLPDIIKCKTIAFQSFTKAQAISLINRYDRFSELDVGLRLIRQLDTVPEKFLETPLLVSLLYRTFGVNNSIADRICTFYDEIYHALYKGHDLMNKNGYTRQKKSELDFEDFRRLLRVTCFYMSISRMTSFESYITAIEHIRKASKVANISPSSAENFLDDLLVSVPLMVREGPEIKFLHKTILEYFAAEYLVYHSDSTTKVMQLFDSKYFQSFEKVFEFLYDISPNLFESTVTLYWAKKIVKLDDALDKKALTLHSLRIMHDCAFGIWEVENYLEDEDEDDENFDIDKTGLPFDVREYHYQKFKLDEVGYFFVLAIGERSVKYHHLAFKELTMFEQVQIKRDSVKAIKEIYKKGPKNSWITLNEQSIELFKGNDEILSVASRMVYRKNKSQSGFTYLSIPKAKGLVDRINAEAKFDDELDGLLS